MLLFRSWGLDDEYYWMFAHGDSHFNRILWLREKITGCFSQCAVHFRESSWHAVMCWPGTRNIIPSFHNWGYNIFPWCYFRRRRMQIWICGSVCFCWWNNTNEMFTKSRIHAFFFRNYLAFRFSFVARRACYSWAFVRCVIIWLCLISGWVFSRLFPKQISCLMASGVGMVGHFPSLFCF